MNIEDFTVTQNETVVILDDDLLFYDSLGKFSGKVTTKYDYVCINSSGNRFFLITGPGHSQVPSEKNYRIHVMNSQGQIVDHLFPYNPLL